MRILANHVPGGIFRCLFDEPLTILQVSDRFLTMFGYTREEIHTLFHDSFWEMIFPQDRERLLQETKLQLQTSSTKELEYRIRRKDGSIVWVLDRGELILEPDGRKVFSCIVVDITKGRKIQEELRLSLERHEIVMDQTNDIIFEWDIHRDTFTFSKNWRKKFGYDPILNTIHERLALTGHIHPEDCPGFLQLLDSIRSGQHYAEFELRLRLTETEYLWCRIRMTCQKDDMGNPVKGVGVIIDINEDKKQAQCLLDRAQRDSLTNLYNKGAVHKLIEQRLHQRKPEHCCALMIIDLDDFRFINNSMGHLFGDAFLVEISHELLKQFRSGDIVGRIGGDEFIACLNDIPDIDTAKARAQQVVEAFHKITIHEQPDSKVSCSIGIAEAPLHGLSFQELYRKADHALYQAKMLGKNQYAVFDEAAMKLPPLEENQHNYTAVSETIDSDEERLKINTALFECVFRILYDSSDTYSAVHSILEIVGRQFDVSRVYIFENTEDNRYCSNTFEWCNEGVEPQMETLQMVSYEKDLNGTYLENFNEEGVFYCRDISELEQSQYEVLAPQGIKSMLQCAILDHGEIRGYVGFDECRVNRYWTQEQIDALTFIAQILSTFLLKKRAQEKTEQNAAALQAILDNQNAWIYAIRPSTYELLYINHKTLELVPEAKVGMPCYRAYFGADTPCELCPARKITEDSPNCLMEVYNPYLQVWSSADASRIDWKGEPAILLCCHDITKLKAEGTHE